MFIARGIHQRLRASVYIALLAMALPASAQVQPPNQLLPDLRNQQQRPADGERAGVLINERQAVALAREQFQGTVLRISLIGEAPNRRYRIRMENAGKVFTVFVHAANGEVTGGN